MMNLWISIVIFRSVTSLASWDGLTAPEFKLKYTDPSLSKFSDTSEGTKRGRSLVYVPPFSSESRLSTENMAQAAMQPGVLVIFIVAYFLVMRRTSSPYLWQYLTFRKVIRNHQFLGSDSSILSGRSVELCLGFHHPIAKYVLLYRSLQI